MNNLFAFMPPLDPQVMESVARAMHDDPTTAIIFTSLVFAFMAVALVFGYLWIRSSKEEV